MDKVSFPTGIADITTDSDPIEITANWVDSECESFGHETAAAISLATVSADGMPNNRFVLLKKVDRLASVPNAHDRGYVFHTNSNSTKGGELKATGVAAITHWNQQIGRAFRVQGRVQPTSAEESDAYFNSRPRDRQVGAWASNQSHEVESLEAMQAALAEWDEKFKDQPVPRPPHWHGWRIIPTRIELWWNRTGRLHERVAFTRSSPQEPWKRAFLFP